MLVLTEFENSVYIIFNVCQNLLTLQVQIIKIVYLLTTLKTTLLRNKNGGKNIDV